MAIEIRFRSGRPVGTPTTFTAEFVHAELEAIRERKGGRLRPPDVVKASTAPDSPLHPAFEWNDAKAAHQHRLDQARRLIRSVIIVRPDEPQVPAFLHVKVETPSGQERFYQNSDVIVERPDEYAAAIRALKRHVLTAEEALNAAKHLSHRSSRADIDIGVLAAVGEALATARAMVERLQ